MESEIMKNLQPEFSPVAVVWSNTIPADAFQFKKGKFGCILYLFACATIPANGRGSKRLCFPNTIMESADWKMNSDKGDNDATKRRHAVRNRKNNHSACWIL